MTHPAILITGATDGIGLELARHYRRQGAQLVLVGRRAPAALDAELTSDGNYCRVDLAQHYAAEIVKAFLHRRGIERLDLLIHNAGVGSYGPAAEETSRAIDMLIDVNLRAPIALTHALLPLLEPARGKIVFIGSVAATLPAPEYAAYGATKAALAGFARSLRVELGGRVRVQVLHPGATRTAMHAKIGAPLERLGWRRFPPPDRVAHAIAASIATSDGDAAIGAGNRLLRAAGIHLGALVDWAATQRSNA